MSKLVEAVVTHPKGIHVLDKDGNRVFAAEGSKVRVKPATMEAFSDRLSNVKVAEAQKAASEAKKEAEAEAKKEE
jgi:hypothetical protein